MLYFQIKFSSVFSPWFCFFSSPNWTGLGQDHYSKWEASHNRATKECHHPAIFLGQKWFSGSYLYRDYHLRRTKPGHQQEGRQCACCAVNCLLTKPGRLVSADAPTLPELTHLSNIWCYDLIQQSSHQKKSLQPTADNECHSEANPVDLMPCLSAFLLPISPIYPRYYHQTSWRMPKALFL